MQTKILAGKYSLIRTIGSGASCKVKLANEIESGRPVAIKIMSDKLDEKLKSLIMNEVMAMSTLEHQYVIR
jgi:serine/threonine protein kinase